MAPKAKAVSFVLVGLMPSALQAISSSRSASPGAADGEAAQPQDDEVREQGEEQDQEVHEDDAVLARERQAEVLVERLGALGRVADEV
jgi:hypothetical protein